MKRLAALTLALGICVNLAGCTRALPLKSHAHIGHALTAWRATPEQQGLFEVAVKETWIALEQARRGAQSHHTPAMSKTYILNALNALNPDLQASGPGLGYGAIRALGDVMDHIDFAAQSDDASLNITLAGARFNENAKQVLNRLELSAEVAQLARTASPAELPGLAEDLTQLLERSLEGADRNENDRLEADSDELGLAQLRTELSEIIAREDPPYHPLGRQYLLGLVRLPTGLWVYDFERSTSLSPGYNAGYSD